MDFDNNVSFFTFTYSDDNLPLTEKGLPTLDYRDFQLYLKKLRQALPYSFRFYVAGEYGTQSQRPHYHCVFFGINPDDYPLVFRFWSRTSTNSIGNFYQCTPIKKHVELIESSTVLGNVYVGYDNSLEALAYVAGYVTKKLSATNLPKHDSERRNKYADGRIKEFHKMSRNPGLGIRRLVQISSQLYEIAKKNGIFPTSIKVNGHNMPFDRTCLKYLSELFPEYFNPLLSAFKIKAEFDVLTANPDMYKDIDEHVLSRLGIASAYRWKKDEQKALNMKKRLSLKGVFEREA